MMLSPLWNGIRVDRWIGKRLGTLLLSFCLVPGYAMADCIGVVTAGGGAEFWKLVEQGAKNAGKKLGIEVYARRANNELNVEGQAALIEAVVHRGCGALVLAPNSPSRAADVERLQALDIATIYIDRDMGGSPLLIIKTDNYAAGALAGRKMVQALGGEGKVAIFRLAPSVVSTTAREQGFIEAAEKGGLEIVVDVYLGTMIGDARFKAMEVLKQAGPIDGIFTPNEVTTLATMVSLKRMKYNNGLAHIGFDSNRTINLAIRNQEIYGTVVQQPYTMGYQGVYAAYQAMRGHRPEAQEQPLLWDTGVVFVDQNNLDQAKIKRILGN